MRLPDNLPELLAHLKPDHAARRTRRAAEAAGAVLGREIAPADLVQNLHRVRAEVAATGNADTLADLDDLRDLIAAKVQFAKPVPFA